MDSCEELTVTFIMKNFKKLTSDQISIALSNSQFAVSILSIISKFSDEQIKVAIPLMSLEQLRTTIPKLQLQQTGVAVQVMKPEQVRTAIGAITRDDKQLLLQNISLLSSCKNKDELQSFIGFIDPIAMAVAVNIPELVDQIIESVGIMTSEQLRVVVPLLNANQLRKVVMILEHKSQMETVFSMIDKKDDIIELLKEEELPLLEERKENLAIVLDSIVEKIPILNERINHLASREEEEEYDAIVRSVKNIKSQIESLQQTTREIQAALKLPLRILNEEEDKDLLSKFEVLSLEIKDLGIKIHSLFLSLSSDKGLLSSLNKQWERIKPSMRADQGKEPSSFESLFVEDDDIAIKLFEAVKQIGNPEAVGTEHYPMTWNDIVVAGFRDSKDFGEKGIATLQQLQKFISSFNCNKSIHSI